MSKFSYGIKDFIRGLSFFYSYILACDPKFFSRNKNLLVYSPTELLNIISLCKTLDSSKTKFYSHQFFEDAIESINFYQNKLNSQMSIKFANDTSKIAYTHVLNLAEQAIYILLKYWKEELEKKLKTKTPSEALKIILSEQQKTRGEDSYPKKIKDDYQKYLLDRFNDL